jgi:hypothetical protein
MDTDALLKQFGLKYEDLNAVERETFNNQVNAIQQGQLTLEKLKENITTMRESLILEMSTHDTGSKQDLFVKARIRNYSLILSLFDGAEKARKALERSLAGVK